MAARKASARKMSTWKANEEEKKPKFKVTDKIPVFGIAGAKRNKNLLKLRQDIEERGRSNDQNALGGGPKVETLYVDTTRNVGVVLGNNDMKILISKWNCRGKGYQ